MYNEVPGPSSQPIHIERANQCANMISDLSLNDQNECIIELLARLKSRRQELFDQQQQESKHLADVHQRFLQLFK